MKNEEIIKRIEENETVKQVLNDSFGGVIYDIANQDKYKFDEDLYKLINNLSESEIKNISNGIIQGAIQFLRGN